MTESQPSARIAYADGERVSLALRAGIRSVIEDEETLNKINVFPVPDGDTGTNLALTLSAVHARLAGTSESNACAVLTTAADAALDGARGNSGAIVAQFLQGMADSSTGSERLDVAQFADAVLHGADYAREAMDEPREGTILSVIRDFADEVQKAQEKTDAGFGTLLRAGLARAEASLADTPNQLEALRKAGVVDAGARGFVDLVRGVVDFVKSGDARNIENWRPAISEEGVEPSAGEEIDLTHRYCSECMVTGENVDRRKLREAVSALGSSMVIAGTRNKIKLHIHVNDPDELFETARRFGKVSGEKADDMQKQQRSAHAPSHAVAVITDSAADIPDDELERLNIHMVPVRLHFGDRSYLDKISMTPDEFYAELKSNPVHPKTSQPAPGDFRRQYQFLASHYRWVISLQLTSAASGTWQAARAAAERTAAGGEILVFDTRNASVGQGLLCVFAAELAAAGKNGKEIFDALLAARQNTHTYIVLRDLTFGVRGGRVPAILKTLADMLRLTTVLTIREDGSIGAAGVIFGRRNLVAKFSNFVLKRHGHLSSCRLAVGHAHCVDDAEALLAELQGAMQGINYSYIAEAGPALGAHAGPGGMVVSVQELED
ncbi:MAG: DegV family EDD domain-containing protein [Gammaproteobacteria bacterium]|nr:DegV family EDD domain-containing protein [Gammaproteobacteria bacterium]